MHCHTRLCQIISVYCYMSSVQLSQSSFTVSLPVYCRARHYQVWFVSATFPLSSCLCPLPMHCHTRHTQIFMSTATCPLSNYLCPLLQSVCLCTATHGIVRLSQSTVTSALSSYLCLLSQEVYLCTVKYDTFRLSMSTSIVISVLFHSHCTCALSHQTL